MPKKTKQNKEWICDQIRIYAGKKTMVEIADICDVVPSTIGKYASQIGVSLEYQPDKRRELWNFIRENGAAKTASEIASEKEVSASHVYYIAKRSGVEIKRRSSRYGAPKHSTARVFNVHLKQNWLV